MTGIVKGLWNAFLRMQRERATAKLLAELDARTLKDIGLESWKGGLGAKLWAHRLGMY